jgi:hypothetical protein
MSTNGTSWNAISGATAATYTATDLTATSYYRAVVTSGVCSAATTDSATITVSPTSVAGTISGATTVCSGTNSTTLTLSGSTGAIQWQMSTNGTSWNAISGATAATYTATDLTATSYYRAVVTSGVCSAATTDSATITVSPTSVAGTISGATTVCSDTNSTTLTLNNSTGDIQWQLSTDNSSFTDINGATSATYTATDLTATSYYRAVVTSGVCSAATTDSATITVSPAPVAGTISGATSVCTGTNSTTLTLNGSSGAIQWQSSSNNITFNDISGATGTNYNVTDLTNTSYYRVVISSGVCTSKTTATATITVNPVTVAGTISGATTVCSGINSTTLSLSGNTGSVQWQISSNNSSFSNISGATSTNYTASNLTATKYYRAVVTSGACSSATTNTVTITTNSLAIAGTISGSATVCIGSNSTTMNLSGYTGSLQWQSSTDNSTFTDIVGATNASYLATNLSTTTYYRVKVTNGICYAVYSATATITINPNSTTIGTVGTITGLSNVCGVTSATYTIQPVAGAAYYSWTLPNGASSTSTNGNSVTVTFDPSFVSGILYVKAINTCGYFSNSKSLSISNKAPMVSIGGITAICGATTTAYLATNVPNTTYSWSVPSGVTITSGDGTNKIYVTIDNTFTSGSIDVVASNACGDTNASLAIETNTKQPQSIIGTTQVCINNNTNMTYSTPMVNGITSYNWSVPVGASIVSGQGTNSISVSYSTTFTTGNIGVSLTGSCGTSPQKIIAVTSLLPKPTITGTSIICNRNAITYDTAGNIVTNTYGTESYSVPVIAGATSYSWSVPSGVTIISGQNTNTIMVSINLATFITGNINITVQNACGSSTTSTLKVSKYSNTAKITGPTSLCAYTSVSYSVLSTVGTNFNWVVPSWMTITSGQGTSSMTAAITGVIDQGTIVLNYVSNCNTNESVSVSIGCPTSTKLISTQCGTTLSAINTIIYANSVSNATSYRFEVTHGSSVNTIDSSTRTFNLTQLSSGVLYGETYTIRVAAQLNGIWQSYGPSCSVNTPAIPTTQIQSTLCGTSLAAIGTTISASTVSIATGYRFEVTNGTTIRTYDSTTNSFNLNLLNGGALYGVTYSIRVAIQYNGIWQNYGTACSVSTPAIPTTQVQDSQCGATLAAIGTIIYANNVTIATAYRFEVTNGSTVRTYDSTSRSFNLNLLNGGALYGVTYSIKVAIKYNGIWQNYGTACAVSTPAIPTTKVQDSQCGTVLPTLATTILANPVTIATGYRFEVTNGNTVRTYNSSTPGFKLTSLTGGATLGVTYSIRVAIQYNGTWQNYGPACNVTAGTGTSKVETAQNDVSQNNTDITKANTIYALPNPYVDTFSIQKELYDSKGLMNISIYNNLGVLIKTIQVEEENLSTTPLGENLPSGVYNIIVTQENSIHTLRVIKR